MGTGLQEVGDNPESVGADRAAGFGDFDDGVDQSLSGLGLRRAPRKLHVDRDLPLREIVFGKVHHLGGDPLAFEIFDLFDGRIVRDG